MDTEFRVTIDGEVSFLTIEKSPGIYVFQQLGLVGRNADCELFNIISGDTTKFETNSKDEAITFIKKFLELTTEDNRTKLQALNLQNTKGQISYFHYAYDEREQVEKLLLDIEKSTTIENLLIYVG